VFDTPDGAAIAASKVLFLKGFPLVTLSLSRLSASKAASLGVGNCSRRPKHSCVSAGATTSSTRSSNTGTRRTRLEHSRIGETVQVGLTYWRRVE
jgi:hypothetical protein